MSIIGPFKAFLVVIFFILSCISIVITQAAGILLSPLPDFKEGWIANTKSHFIVCLISIFKFLSSTPIHLHVSAGTPFMKRRISKTESGDLKVLLPARTVVIANHQIYTDWAYIWYFLFKAEVSSFLYIMLKDSLKNIPVLGFGMQRFNFIFLSRSWKKDEATLNNALSRIDANGRGKCVSSGSFRNLDGEFEKGKNKDSTWPYSLVLFPEGTNISANTRSKTEAYAEKTSKQPFRHVLLPKVTGLRYSLLKLKDSVDEVIDLTIGYSGVKADEYGQDIYKLEDILMQGKNPDVVSIHVENLKLADIPIGQLQYANGEEEKRDVQLFEDWVYQRWTIKDELMDKFYKAGRFVDDESQIVESQLQYEWKTIAQTFMVPVLLGILITLSVKYYKVLEDMASVSTG